MKITDMDNRSVAKQGTQSAESVFPEPVCARGEGVILTLYVLQLLLS